MPRLFWKAWSWFLCGSRATRLEEGRPPFLAVHLHDNELFVPRSSLLPRLIT